MPDSVQALIAARLDTLSPDRKSLLQDAAVLGKVFWAGALAEMGERDPAEVEQALHELSRKELVRPARTSSMEGEHEYAFWHVLVRDVCYGQIPRAARAARHQAAAAWIEQKAGERVEDQADVLAHHYLAALELARAAGSERGTRSSRRLSVTSASPASGRSRSTSTRPRRNSTRHWSSLPPTTSTRGILEHWAQAAQQQGRLRRRRRRSRRPPPSIVTGRQLVAAGGVLARLALVLSRLGD